MLKVDGKKSFITKPAQHQRSLGSLKKWNVTKCSVFWVQCYKNQKRANAFDWHWVDQHIAAWGDMNETVCVCMRG